ncbi:molybdenum cofactor guanylyltransferase [Halosimplex aquaticum]|uniref:Probable molybdenum cofactor guanylyltransferase n=1 Tax=Halosimplex aquaticum TaxID=3026162 RepID=A0ABD5XWT8_9EURY|nr:molybdenum cofactor guanylyltransferase [Halosimplex aquaticum]
MAASPPERVRGVVLAGGRSTRFGEENKALARLDGRPVVAHVVETVAEATDGTPVLSVATDSQAEQLCGALGRPVETVRDGVGRSGPLAGLAAAAEAVDAPWLFVCACDMPLVTPESVDALCARAAAVDGDCELDAVVPVVDGYDQPLHALYRRSAFGPALDSLSEDGAMMALLDRLTVERFAAAETDAPLGAATTNVNTRADLAALRDD